VIGSSSATASPLFGSEKSSSGRAVVERRHIAGFADDLGHIRGPRNENGVLQGHDGHLGFACEGTLGPCARPHNFFEKIFQFLKSGVKPFANMLKGFFKETPRLASGSERSPQ
jgi:hypothetical protein